MIYIDKSQTNLLQERRNQSSNPIISGWQRCCLIVFPAGVCDLYLASVLERNGSCAYQVILRLSLIVFIKRYQRHRRFISRIRKSRVSLYPKHHVWDDEVFPQRVHRHAVPLIVLRSKVQSGVQVTQVYTCISVRAFRARARADRHLLGLSNLRGVIAKLTELRIAMRVAIDSFVVMRSIQ